MLLRQSLANASSAEPRWTVPITEVQTHLLPKDGLNIPSCFFYAFFSPTLCPHLNASHTERRYHLLSSCLSSVKPLLICSQVEGDEETLADSESSCRGEDVTINLQPTNAHEFGQALNAACCGGNTAACADLLASTAPDKLPQYLSTQLDGHTVSFLMQALDSHLLKKNPNLVYQHLKYLHTTDRFSVSFSFGHYYLF